MGTDLQESNGKPPPPPTGGSPNHVSPATDVPPAVHAGTGKGETPGILNKISSFVANVLETGFYRLGLMIGRRPALVIVIVILCVGACGGGLYFFDDRTGDDTLWVPDNSPAIDDQRAVEEHFASRYRFQNHIATADNVLTTQVIRAMSRLDQEIRAIEGEDGQNWPQLCSRVGSECWSTGILELWSFDPVIINSLTQEQLLRDVNTITVSPVYQSEYDVTQYLSDITRDNNGDITAAAAATMKWVLQYNDTTSQQTGKSINDYAFEWEKKFIEISEAGDPAIRELYYLAASSRDEEGSASIQDDVQLLSAGYSIVILFVIFGLSKFNSIEHRVYQSLAGILSIGLAMCVSYGIASLSGWFYTPLHTILPFLMLGIGVDDMYVIVQAWNNLPPAVHRTHPLHVRVALMLKHAGVSVTITSVTDIIAFGIGAFTTLPALRSFCIYCCIGITALYVIQATMFVAVHTLNQRRAESRRNACIPCYTHSPDYKTNQCSQRDHVALFFKNYITLALKSIPVKILVILLSCGMIAVGVWGTLKLEQDSDPTWFIPSGSYASHYYSAVDDYFPADGMDTAMYLGDINYYGSKSTLETLYSNIQSNYAINNKTLYGWTNDFYEWMETTQDPTAAGLIDTDTKYPNNEADYYTLLDLFLATEGSRYTSDIRFKLENNQKRIVMSRYKAVHTKFNTAVDRIDAMDSLQQECDFTELERRDCFAFGRWYLINEGNRAIQGELYRNIGLAFAAVVLLSLLLIAHLGTAALVSLCVILTLIDVGGLMYLWDLTIDTVTTILLIIAIGLAIDYAAHIGHCWMTTVGSREQRMCQTITRMGPAVFYGGFSTFLAFVLLAFSGSYVFKTFFKLFFGVVVFGLWHGLMMLPVVLSIIGPDPYLSARPDAAEGTNSSAMDRKDESGEFYDNRVFDAGDSKPPGGYLDPPQTPPGGTTTQQPQHGGDDGNCNNSNGYIPTIANGYVPQLNSGIANGYTVEKYPPTDTEMMYHQHQHPHSTTALSYTGFPSTIKPPTFTMLSQWYLSYKSNGASRYTHHHQHTPPAVNNHQPQWPYMHQNNGYHDPYDMAQKLY